METRNEETTDTGIDHNAGITSDNVALNVTAAILVGGEARRLGGIVKPSLRINDARILDRQLGELRAAGLNHITLVGRWHDAPVAGTHHLPDAVDGAGALGGLYTALIAATGSIVVVLAGDMPFVSATWLRAVADVGDVEAKVPRTGSRWHPLCAAYRRGVATRLKARLDRGDLRVTDALNELRVRAITEREIAEFDPTCMLLMNVNTPDDVREAERLARLHA